MRALNPWKIKVLTARCFYPLVLLGFCLGAAVKLIYIYPVLQLVLFALALLICGVGFAGCAIGLFIFVTQDVVLVHFWNRDEGGIANFYADRGIWKFNELPSLEKLAIRLLLCGGATFCLWCFSAFTPTQLQVLSFTTVTGLTTSLWLVFLYAIDCLRQK